MALTKKSNRPNQPNKSSRLIPIKSYHLAVPPKLALVIGPRPRPGGYQVPDEDEDEDYDSLFGSPVLIYTGQEEHRLQSPPQELLKRRRRLYVPARVVGGRLVLCRSKSVYARKARPLSSAPADFAFYHPTVPYMAAAPVFLDNLAQYFSPMQASEQAYPAAFDFHANIVPMDEDITASSDLESFDMVTDEDAEMMDSLQCKGICPIEDANMASPKIDSDINPFRTFHSRHYANGLSSSQVVVVDQTASQNLDGVQQLSGSDMEIFTKQVPAHEVDSLASLLSGLSISEELTTLCPSLESDLEPIPIAWDDVKDEFDTFLSVEGREQHEHGVCLEETEREEQDLIDFESEVLLPVASSLDKENLATCDQFEVPPSNVSEDAAICPSASGLDYDVTAPGEPEYEPVPVPVVAASEPAEADKDETSSKPQPSRPAYRRVTVSNYQPMGCHAMRSKLFVRLPVLKEVLKREPRIFVPPNNRFKSNNDKVDRKPTSKFQVKADEVKTEGSSRPKAWNYPPMIVLPDSPVHSSLLRNPTSSTLPSESSQPKQLGKVLLWNTSSKMEPPSKPPASKPRSTISTPARFSHASTRVSQRTANYHTPLSSSMTRTIAAPPTVSTVNVYSHVQAKVEPPKKSLIQKMKEWFTPSSWWV